MVLWMGCGGATWIYYRKEAVVYKIVIFTWTWFSTTLFLVEDDIKERCSIKVTQISFDQLRTFKKEDE